MELIIKPTSECNFTCSFCAASNLKIPTLSLVPAVMADLIYRCKPDTIIVTGGEPFMCPPSFYRELDSIARDIDATISITSNLWKWYEDREKWLKDGILRSPRIQVGTSFNYGDSRRKGKMVLTPETFAMMMNTFWVYYNYMPTFIGVIDDKNQDKFFDNIKLAKDLCTTCKLNNANAIGRQAKAYQRPDIMEKFLEVLKNNQEDLEQNTRDRATGSCPINSNLLCQETIRCIYMGEDGYIYWSNCEEKANLGLAKRLCNQYGEYTDEMEAFLNCTYPQITLPNETITENCYNCELFRFCNGCDINRMNAKQDPDYCTKMLSLKDKIIENGWMI